VRYAIFLLLAVSLTAESAETFEAREQRATMLEETSAGKAYQDAMWPLVKPFLAELIKQCISNEAKPDLTSFRWVATVTADGKLADVEVQPETGVSKCFSLGIVQAPFPKPPKEFAEDGLPVAFNMRLHPMN
jgi:hypothetical protein